VEVTDGIGLELAPPGLAVLDVRQPRDVVALGQRCKDERVKCGIVA
jgi:hypothetical protein